MNFFIVIKRFFKKFFLARKNFLYIRKVHVYTLRIIYILAMQNLKSKIVFPELNS